MHPRAACPRRSPCFFPPCFHKDKTRCACVAGPAGRNECAGMYKSARDKNHFPRSALCDWLNKRPDARSGLAFAARENHKRPRPLPFMIFFLTVVNPTEERPQHGGGIAIGRARLQVKWHHCQESSQAGGIGVVGGFDVTSRSAPGTNHAVRADVDGGFEINRPEREKLIVTADRGSCRRSRWSAWSRPYAHSRPAARIASLQMPSPCRTWKNG